MPEDELPLLSIDAAHRLIRSRQVSPVELVRATLDRIRRYDDALHCYLTLTADIALEQARVAETEIMNGGPRGALHGIPFGLKDVYETAGIRTTAGSSLLADHVPARDAATAELLRGAGAILVGKHMTHEFAHGGPSCDTPWPNPENPWKQGYFTGGSSSGSAAAVASGLCAAALGTDTGGSVRNPASFCGVVGLKPTYGRVSKRGVITNAFSLDHCGPLTWNVLDCAHVLQAIAGHDPGDPSSVDAPVPDYAAGLGADMKGRRIGVVRHFYMDDTKCHPEQVAALEVALNVLAGLGMEVEDVRLSPLDLYSDVKLTISASELYAYHAANLRHRADRFGSVFRFRAMTGAMIHASDYLLAQQLRRRLMLELDSVLERYDALVLPGANGPAPLLKNVDPMAYFEKPSLAAPFNVTGHPAISLCAGFSSAGLPLAIQFAGRQFGEAALLQIAHAYECASGWRERRPDLSSFSA